MSTIRFVRAAAVGEIPVGGRRIAFIEGKAIALFNVDGTVYALEDSCPHAGSSLAAGKLDGPIVTCRAHGLRFDVRTGRMAGVDGLCAKARAVDIADGEIRVALDGQA